MYSGKLTKRLSFYNDQGEQRETDGFTPPDWQQAFSAWGTLTPVSGGETVLGVQIQANISHTMIIRWRPDCNSTQQVRHCYRRFELKSVIDIEEKHEWCLIQAVELLPPWEE